jgi:PST family polysaccharide transporter
MTSEHSRGIGRNSAWMVGEQVIRLAIAMLLTAWIARSLGPIRMGHLSFALALYSLLGVVATVGLNRIIVREFSSNTDASRERELLLTSLAMRFIASGTMAICAVLFCFLTAPELVPLVLIIVPGYFFSAFDLISLLYQANHKSGIVARARLLAFAVSSLVKATMLYLGAGVELIALACLLDWAFSGTALAILYVRDTHGIWSSRPRMSLARQLLSESAIEIVAGFSGMAFMRIDQLMLQTMRGPSEVAIMAVSTRLTEAWYFVPAAIVASTFPIIVRLRQSDPDAALQHVRKLYRHVSALSLLAAVLVTFLAEDIVGLVFGHEYLASADVLVIQIWCGLFMSFGLASGSWLISNRQGGLNLKRNLLGVAINILLNFWLIPGHGALGAAWATLGAFACAYFIFDFITPSTRQMGMDKLRALMWRHK